MSKVHELREFDPSPSTYPPEKKQVGKTVWSFDASWLLLTPLQKVEQFVCSIGKTTRFFKKFKSKDGHFHLPSSPPPKAKQAFLTLHLPPTPPPLPPEKVAKPCFGGLSQFASRFSHPSHAEAAGRRSAEAGPRGWCRSSRARVRPRAAGPP